jgi:hypothetical protein
VAHARARWRRCGNHREKKQKERYTEGSVCHRLEVTLSSPIVIHVLRPYANEEEYLASERFSIDSKSMLLIDQPPLPAETPIVFDIQLQNGQKPIRAEAKVIGSVAATSDKPGGLRVRFKRFGAATKAFIDRAVAVREPGALLEPTPQAAPPISIRSAPSLVPALEPGTQGPTLALPELAKVPASAADRGESSGIHRRPVVPVAAPVNREELLAKLRTRARSVGVPQLGDSHADANEQTG